MYAVPLACALGEKADPVCRDWPPLVLARVSVKQHRSGRRHLRRHRQQDFLPRAAGIDFDPPPICQAGKANWSPPTRAVLRRLRQESGLDLEPAVSKAEQTNSSVIYGDRLILKFFRKLEPGVNPELEIGRFLMARRFPYCAAAGRRAGISQPARRTCHGGRPHLVCARLQRRLGIHAWTRWAGFTSGSKRCLRKTARPRRCPPLPLSNWRRASFPKRPRSMIGSYLQDARLLGERTAAMHLALAAETATPISARTVDASCAARPVPVHAQSGAAEFPTVESAVAEPAAGHSGSGTASPGLGGGRSCSGSARYMNGASKPCASASTAIITWARCFTPARIF